MAVDQVDDPVDGDAGVPINLGHHSIVREAGLGDLDDEGDVGRPGMAIRIIPDAAPDHASVGLGLAGLPR